MRMAWAKMPAETRAEKVRELVDKGEAYSTIAWRLGAPSRNVIAGLVNRLRAAGQMPAVQKAERKAKPAPPRPKKNPEAKTSEDNGRITGGAGPVTGEVSRVDAGRTASATSERMDATAGRDRRSDPEVERFIASNGVRRFEPGANTDLVYLQNYLAAKGYVLTFTQKGGGIYTVTGHGPTRRLARADFFRFVDRVRLADGLEPILPTAKKEACHAASA